MPVLAQRVTFVGELGWELYAPAEYGLTLWDLLLEAGREHGLLGGGYRAIDSMRLEKGYRVWGADITPETTPDEAGLSFAVAMDKEGGFLGHDGAGGRARGRRAGRSGCAAWCWTTRGRCAWAPSRCAVRRRGPWAA